MSYSVGGRDLPLINDNSISALDAVSKAYDSMNNAMEKLANLPFIGKKLIQDNADARYSAALNKFSNDPEGLANALNNGDIDTTDVTADTLNQTQERLSAIGNNYSRNYIQNRIANANDYFDKNSAKYQEAVNEAQAGHPEKLAQIRASLGEVPWEVTQQYAQLNGQAEKDAQQSLNNQGGALALQRQAMLDTQASNIAAWKLLEQMRKNDFTQDPTRTQAEVNRTLHNADPTLIYTLLKTKEGFNFLSSLTGGQFYKTSAAGVDNTQSTNTVNYKWKSTAPNSNAQNYTWKY